MTSRRRPATGPAPAAPASAIYEAEVVVGLEAIAWRDLTDRLGSRLRPLPTAAPGVLRFAYGGPPGDLLRSRTVAAISLVGHFAVPRPRALLGEEHLRRLVDQVGQALRLAPPATFTTLTLSAAGADSTIMTRVKQAVAERTGLTATVGAGDLLLRLRRPAADEGWEALVRLTPRPLTARPWRVRDLPGALNATIAQAMIRLTQPTSGDMFLNLACGSATLLIERLAWGPARRAIGCDVSPAALACAQANVAAAGLTDAVELADWDARALPLPDAWADALCADLPFGQLTGSHQANLTLYPAILREAARVARPGARFAVITHEVRLLERLLDQATDWRVEQVLRLQLEALRPRVYVLRRN